MRGLDCQLAALEKPDGSVIFMQGDTKIMCGVYGPAEVKVNKEIIDKATSDCILKPKVGLPGVKDKAIEEILMQTCDQAMLTYLHPRSAIQLVLQVMHDAGSLVSCLLNGACMAMVHCGLPMKYMFVAISCVITSHDEYLVDPTSLQEKDCKCLFTFSFETKTYNLISSYTKGKFTLEEYFKCLQLCRTSSKEIASFQRLALEKYILKETFENESETGDEEVTHEVAVVDDDEDEEMSETNE